MDGQPGERDACSHPAAATAAAAPHREPFSLTGHLSQPSRATLTRRSPPASPSAQLPDHPFNFNFPTLNLDGSLPDLTPLSSRSHPPTPPAALSSLGAKARMARHNDDGSESELTDGQYDMVDDLSEISTDDHDTASLASNGDEDQLTPEESVCEIDADESTLLLDSRAVNMASSQTQSFVNLSSHPSNMAESYISDDLTTPRQSLVPVTFSSTYHQSIAATSTAQQDPTSNAVRILFISDSKISQSLMDAICISIAACLKYPDASNLAEHRVVRLPKTPSGISPPSATVVYSDDTVSATVQHCVGAEVRSKDTVKLRIMDSDREHSSFFTVGTDGKIDLIQPDIAVFYLDENATGMRWLSRVSMALEALKAPALMIHHPSINLESLSPMSRSLLGDSLISASLKSDELFDGDKSQLCDFLWGLMNAPPRSSSNRDGCRAKGSPYRRFILRLIALFVLVLPTLLLYSRALLESRFDDPAARSAARREGLIQALSLVTGSSNVTKDFNITHLTSAALFTCSSDACEPSPHYQAGQPNHVVVSLPGRPNFPEVTNAHVWKADGRKVAFNRTQLIEGIHLVTIDPAEAYGVVTISMLTRKPYLNVTAPHNFGNRMLQRKTYEKASTDVRKEVSKDVAVMKNAAKILTDKISTEFGAGVWATKNITTQLALYVARDLQVFGNTAASFLGKAAKASNQTVSILSTDFVLIRQDVARFSTDLSTLVLSKVEQAKKTSKALIRSPLAVSRGRLEGLKRSLHRRGCIRRMRKEMKKAASSFTARSTINSPKAKHELKRMAQQLETMKRVFKRKVDNSGQKLSRGELQRMKKEVRRQEKIIKKAKVEIGCDERDLL